MSTLRQLRSGFSRALDTISEGWNELVERTGNALTRFHLPRSGSGVETPEDRVARDGVRWGVLAAEVSVDEESVHVAMEVPGMNKDSFDIHLTDDVLVVRGEKKVERESKHGRYYVMERAYGRFAASRSAEAERIPRPGNQICSMVKPARRNRSPFLTTGLRRSSDFLAEFTCTIQPHA